MSKPDEATRLRRQTGNRNMTAENEIYRSVKYSAARVAAVYARGYSDGTIKFFEVDAKSRTLREYWRRREECSPAVQAKVDVNDQAFGQIKLSPEDFTDMGKA